MSGQVLGVHAYPLLFVVRAPVSDHDLRRVLVGHHNGGLGKAGSEAQGVVGLEWLFQHACVEVILGLEGSPVIEINQKFRTYLD
jgi:hypothetical protein